MFILYISDQYTRTSDYIPQPDFALFKKYACDEYFVLFRNFSTGFDGNVLVISAVFEARLFCSRKRRGASRVLVMDLLGDSAMYM